MKKIIMALTMGMLAGSAWAASDEAAGVQMFSGGIGSEERAEIQRVQDEYSLKFTFVGKDGVYLSDVHVRMQDAEGNILFQTLTEGPVLLVQLKPGKYTATIEIGVEVRRLDVTVPNSGRGDYVVRFPNIVD